MAHGESIHGTKAAEELQTVYREIGDMIVRAPDDFDVTLGEILGDEYEAGMTRKDIILTSVPGMSIEDRIAEMLQIRDRLKEALAQSKASH